MGEFSEPRLQVGPVRIRKNCEISNFDPEVDGGSAEIEFAVRKAFVGAGQISISSNLEQFHEFLEREVLAIPFQ
jgi:hypothetical protein